MTYDRYDSKIFVATEYEIEYEIIFRKNGPKLVEIRVWIYSWWDRRGMILRVFKIYSRITINIYQIEF